MKTLKLSTLVQAPIAEVFNLTQDYPRRMEWDPYLCEATLLNADAPGMGVDVRCTNHKGQSMVTRFISWKPPHVTAVTMTDGPWLLKKFSGAWNFSDQGDGVTLVTFTYNFELRAGVFRLLQPAAIQIFKNDMKKRLAALDQYFIRSNPAV